VQKYQELKFSRANLQVSFSHFYKLPIAKNKLNED